jgi:hypothetical protein
MKPVNKCFLNESFQIPRWVVLLAFFAIVSGCGSERPLVPVSGRATYGGGEWPMSGNINFTPASSSEGSPVRPGSASFDKDGKFVVGSFQPEDGLMPGVYHVSISCLDPLDFSTPREELDFVPQDFKTEELVVEAGMDPIELNFDVPKKQTN